MPVEAARRRRDSADQWALSRPKPPSPSSKYLPRYVAAYETRCGNSFGVVGMDARVLGSGLGIVRKEELATVARG
jgi:hypothetical protein